MKQRLIPILAGILTAGILVGCSDSDSQNQAGAANARPPTPVSYIELESGSYPLTTVLPGRAAAYQQAEIRPQVTGVIREVSFREGSEVKQGDILYQIEDNTYLAEVARAKAAVTKAEAAVPTAKANLARYERLVNSGASQMELENARLTVLQADADVAQAKAALESAEINLALTKVRAPFDGVTTANNFSIGNVVTANQPSALTTIRRIDPIYIDLMESSANLLRLRAAMESGRVNGGINNEVSLTLENGTEYKQIGKIEMSDLAVSQTTGTFSIRVLFENPDDLILPGSYVRATLNVGDETGFLIPQRAASRNGNGELTAMFIGENNIVETRIFTKSNQSGSNWLVDENVKDGDKLIVDGFQWIANGIPVTPVLATINEKGLVVVTPQASTPAPSN